MSDIAGVNRLLASVYGDRPWRSHNDPLSELVTIILSQNTSDTNSFRAYDSLRERFGNWDAVARADVSQIEETIRAGGLSQVKAARIKTIFDMILKERGKLTLEFLDDLSLEDAKVWLRHLPGVGPKTVACVLLFSLGKPVFPVDTHVYRVAKRLGFISGPISAEQAHKVLGEMIPAEDVYRMHMNMVDHGRKVCKSQKPKCSECVLGEICPWRQSTSKS